MHRTLLTFHRWLGLVAGTFLLLIGASGSLLVFNNSLEHWFHPELYHLSHSGIRLPIDSLYSTIYKKYSNDFSALSLDTPSGTDEVFEFTLTREENFHSKRIYIVDIDPYSGTILREGDCRNISTSLMHWIMYFHDSFHFGTIGMLIVTLASLSICCSIVTGIVIYRKNIFEVFLFKLPLRNGSRQLLYRSLHIYIGVWALLFNTVVFFTGFWMVKTTLSPSAWKLDDNAKEKYRLTASVDSCIVKSREVVSGFEPDFISISFIRGEQIEIDGNLTTSPELFWGDMNYVMFDPEKGNVTEVRDIRNGSLFEKISSTFWQLHTGGYGGSVMKILYALGGLTPGLLSISGFVMWSKDRIRDEVES